MGVGVPHAKIAKAKTPGFKGHSGRFHYYTTTARKNDKQTAKNVQHPDHCCRCHQHRNIIFNVIINICVVVKTMVPFWGTLNIRCRIIIGI